MRIDFMQRVWRSEMKWRQSDGGHECSACCQHLNIIGPVRALPPICPHTHDTQIYDNCKKKKNKWNENTNQAFQELKPPRLSSDSLLTILTVDLDVIEATYKCTPAHINLSVSFSWCSSCSLVVMVLQRWWASLWQPTVQPARDSYGRPASGEPSSADRGQGLPLIDSPV